MTLSLLLLDVIVV